MIKDKKWTLCPGNQGSATLFYFCDFGSFALIKLYIVEDFEDNRPTSLKANQLYFAVKKQQIPLTLSNMDKVASIQKGMGEYEDSTVPYSPELAFTEHDYTLLEQQREAWVKELNKLCNLLEPLL